MFLYRCSAPVVLEKYKHTARVFALAYCAANSNGRTRVCSESRIHVTRWCVKYCKIAIGDVGSCRDTTDILA